MPENHSGIIQKKGEIMKKTFVLIALFLFVSAFAAEMKIDFSAPSPWKEMRNHSKRVKFENKEFKGKKATVVSIVPDVKGTDTAFSLFTKMFPVKGRKEITVSFAFLGSKGMKDFKGGGYWCSAVRFYNSARKEILPESRIILPPATGTYQNVVRQIPVPAGAVNAFVHFGFDNPNITKNNIFAITDVVITY